MTEQVYDIAVIGGGINGCGIARDAAGRGYRVLLCEQHDLAAHTSSASTKLIHGGLRYLENYEFGLVRKALQERELLLRAAPHLIHPLRFILPHLPGMRPAWMIRAGLFLYDHLAHRELLPASGAVDLRRHVAGAPLQAAFSRGFAYSDGWVDDARLVVSVAIDAAARGARLLPRTRCTGAQRSAEGWRLQLRGSDGASQEVRCRALVNAAGPWAEAVLRGPLATPPMRHLRLVQGSHIVVPQLFAHDHAYLFQIEDGRIVFAIPYQGRFTLIGTTEVEFAGDPAAAAISEAEVAYLCAAANRFFRRQITPAAVRWSFSGVRPLLEDESAAASAVTRDYALDLEAGPAPLLSLFGGKLTTFRKLAEEVVNRLQPLLGGGGPAWTASVPLPGGEIAGADFAGFEVAMAARYPWCPPALLARWLRAYGTRSERLLAGVRDLGDLGPAVAPGLYARELDYLCREEWAVSAEDILWRRTKLGLEYSAEQRQAVADWLAQRGAQRASRA